MTDATMRIATKIFAVSLIAFGVQQIVTGTLVAGRPPAWPSSMSGELIIASVTGTWLIFNGIFILIERKTNLLIPTALFILIFCAARNFYVIITDHDVGISLTNFGKGVTLASGLLFISSIYPYSFKDKPTLKPIDYFFVSGCFYGLGFFLLVSGVQHFIFSDFVKFLVPSWIPFPLFWTYASGIALAITGLSVMTGFKRPFFSLWGSIMIFSWIIVLHIPLALQKGNSQNEWTALFEALAFSTLLFMISKLSQIKLPLAVQPAGLK